MRLELVRLKAAGGGMGDVEKSSAPIRRRILVRLASVHHNAVKGGTSCGGKSSNITDTVEVAAPADGAMGQRSREADWSDEKEDNIRGGQAAGATGGGSSNSQPQDQRSGVGKGWSCPENAEVVAEQQCQQRAGRNSGEGKGTARGGRRRSHKC